MTNPLDELKRYLELSEYVEFTDSKGRLLHSIKSEKLLLPFLAHEQLQSKLYKACEALEEIAKPIDLDLSVLNRPFDNVTCALEALAEIRKKDDNG